MKKVYNLSCVKSEGSDGKTYWQNVGIMIEKDNGKMSIHLDCIPVGNWDGWITINEKKPRDENYQSHKSQVYDDNKGVEEDDIPF